MTTFSKQTSRKRFPNWLREQVDKGELSGVYWLDEEKTTFRVPWTRVDSPDFNLTQDALLFQKWAEFTGRYRIGERTDPSVWKTRFRCAIRKMTEIEELKMENNLDDTNGQQPFRVFRFKKEANRPKRKEFKRKYKYRTSRRILKSRQNAPLVYGQYHYSSSREIKQGLGVVLAHGMTQSVTQTLTNGKARETALTVYNGVSPDFMAHGVTQNDGMTPDRLEHLTQNEGTSVTNAVIPNVTPKYVTNNNMSVTHSSTHYGRPDMSLQKVFIGFSPSSRDTTYFPNGTMENTNFETNVTQCSANNALYRSENMTTTNTLVNTPWPNQMGEDGGNTMQQTSFSSDLLSASPSNLPIISLQEIKNVLCSSEPGGEMSSAPYTSERPTAYSAVPLEGENNKSLSNYIFEEQDCQEIKSYNTSLMLNDLNEIFQQSIKIELEPASNINGQGALKIRETQDYITPALSSEYFCDV